MKCIGLKTRELGKGLGLIEDGKEIILPDYIAKQLIKGGIVKQKIEKKEKSKEE